MRSRYLPVEGIVGSAILIVWCWRRRGAAPAACWSSSSWSSRAYVFIGPHMPGDFATQPVSLPRLIVYLGLDTNGIIGAILSVAVLIVVPFTLMGQVLGRTGGAAYFADLAMSAMGRFRGGAAKIAVFGSALFGMISGAAVSNVVAVGIVTIPLMSRSGFSPNARRGNRSGRLDRRPTDAAGDGRRRLHHGGIPASALRRRLHRRNHPGGALLRRLVHPRRPGSRQAARSARRKSRHPPKFGEVLKSGWHFPIPLVFLVATIAYPETLSDPDRARGGLFDGDPDRAQHDLRLSRQPRRRPGEMLRAMLDTGRAALDIVLIGAAAGMVVGALSISGISFGLTLQLIALSGQQSLRAAAPDRGHQHHSRHGHADGERLCAHRDAAGAFDRSSSASRRWRRTCT